MYRRIAFSYVAFFVATSVINGLHGIGASSVYAVILAGMAMVTLVLLLLPGRVTKTINLLWLYTVAVGTQAVSSIGEFEGMMMALVVLGTMFWQGFFKSRAWLRLSILGSLLIGSLSFSLASSTYTAPSWPQVDIYSRLLVISFVSSFIVRVGILLYPLVNIADENAKLKLRTALYEAGIHPGEPSLERGTEPIALSTDAADIIDQQQASKTPERSATIEDRLRSIDMMALADLPQERAGEYHWYTNVIRSTVKDLLAGIKRLPEQQANPPADSSMRNDAESDRPRRATTIRAKIKKQLDQIDAQANKDLPPKRARYYHQNTHVVLWLMDQFVEKTIPPLIESIEQMRGTLSKGRQSNKDKSGA